MRSLTAPALLSQLAKSGHLLVGHGQIGFLEHPSTANTALALAAAEAVADKLPFMPSRTRPVPLIGRAISGGFTGAAICSSKKRPVWIGAVIGAAAAVGAAYGAYELRRRAVKKLNAPDAVLALAEDAVVAAMGFVAVSRLRRAE
jgi:uncharacterized membrane protein